MGTCISSKDYEKNEEMKQQEETVKLKQTAKMVDGNNIADIA